MCVLDILSMKVMTGISYWRLRPGRDRPADPATGMDRATGMRRDTDTATGTGRRRNRSGTGKGG